MPLDKNMSHEEMVAELINGYKKTGKIGATKPRDMKHALEIANAVAYNLGESNTVRKVKEMNLEQILESLETFVSSKEKELGIFNEAVKPVVKVTFDNGETIETEVADNATDDDIRNYYAVGKEFNLGQGGQDKMAKVKDVTVTRNVGEDLEFIPTEVEFANENPTDVISMDVPLFLRLLEWAKEDAQEDVELHDVAERAVKIMQNNTEFLTMDEYDEIINGCCTGFEPPIDEADMGDMGADQVLPFGKKNKVKTLKNKKATNRK